MHHLSCQANTDMIDKNTVLCIHYKTNSNEHKTYALPGIRHIPSKDTLDDWIKSKKELQNN